jgi:CHASE2 domain-containing sensor protein
VALFPQDSDWVVRTFQRWFRLGNGTLPSMHWEILRAYCDSGSQEACGIVQNAPSIDSRPHFLPNHYEFPPITLNDVLPAGDNKAVRRIGVVQSDNILRGKIVILGAAFADDHPTPFGIQQGADLIASAVETELDRTGEPFVIRGWTQLSIKIVLALILAVTHYYFRPLYALGATLLVVCGVIVLSFVAYYYQALRVDFLPFVIGIWIEQLYQGAEHAQRISPIKSS